MGSLDMTAMGAGEAFVASLYVIGFILLISVMTYGLSKAFR